MYCNLQIHRLRDKIYDNIALLSQVMNNQEEAVRIGVLEAKKLNNFPITNLKLEQ